jgi:hypothetical protein
VLRAWQFCMRWPPAKSGGKNVRRWKGAWDNPITAQTSGVAVHFYSGAPENCWLSRSGVQMCASDCTLEMGQEGDVGRATPGVNTP